MNFSRPLLGSDRVAVKRVYHRKAPVLLAGVAGGQEHQDLALRRISFQVSVQPGAVNFDVLDGCGFGARHDGGHFRLHLGESG